MICTRCGIEKGSGEFVTRLIAGEKQTACKECMNMKYVIKGYKQSTRDLRHKNERISDLLADIVEDYECRDSKRLKRDIRKAKEELGKTYSRKVVNE